VGILLGAVVALTYGTADFLGGISSRRLPVPAVLVGGQLTGLTLITALVLSTSGNELSTSAVAHGVGAGVGSFIGLALFFQGLSTGSMAVIAPIAAIGSAIVPFAWAVAVGGERPGTAALAGVVLAVVGVAVVARPAEVEAPVEAAVPAVGMPPARAAIGAPRPVDLVRAAASGAAFGTVFVLLGDAGDKAGLIPVLFSRLTSLPMAVVWLAIYVSRTGWRPAASLRTRATAGLVVSQGVFDSSANALFIAAAHHGLLSEVSVVSALYPAPTVVLAAVVLHEKISRAQRFGLVLVLAGVALIAT
jgi:drug/metabolite transporter (DMT)-like permease